jgi:hypothetical protein
MCRNVPHADVPWSRANHMKSTHFEPCDPSANPPQVVDQEFVLLYRQLPIQKLPYRCVLQILFMHAPALALVLKSACRPASPRVPQRPPVSGVHGEDDEEGDEENCRHLCQDLQQDQQRWKQQSAPVPEQHGSYAQRWEWHEGSFHPPAGSILIQCGLRH